MRLPILSLMLFAAAASVTAQGHKHAVGTTPVTVIKELGRSPHPIATTNTEAQQLFDQALALVYGFNHEEAIRTFRRVAELDPKSPMPHWGIALALGPNINMEMSAEASKEAYAAIEQAAALAANAPEHERAYIDVLRKRYSADPNANVLELSRNYAAAMRDLVKRYPEDLDAVTLYAEGLMVLSPWQYWTSDGKPQDNTLEIVDLLESVLRRDPSHIGANHYYIHALEASPSPERALPSAVRLGRLTPFQGHLVHMPAHIYVRTGEYAAASRANVEAIAADEQFMNLTNVQGMYTMMYYNHNIHFLVFARTMEGRFDASKKSADQLVRNLTPAVKDMPMAEMALPAPTFVLLRFHRWKELLAMPDAGTGLAIVDAVSRFARAAAHAALGNAIAAEQEMKAFDAARGKLPDDALLSGNNRAKPVLDVASLELRARIAAARGRKDAAIDLWRKAVAAQDALAYDEPPPWYYPIRESLGAALLRAGKADEAVDVFRADLVRNPRNGRSLFGLWEALRALGRTSEARWVQRQFEAAWKQADVKLRIEEF
jgi:tetratricopeptide (TPR) repeat protein